MKLYLVRHGESQSNYDNKHNRAYFVSIRCAIN